MASTFERLIRRVDAVPVAPAAAVGAAVGTAAGAALLWAPSVPRVVMAVAVAAAAVPLARAAGGATEVVPAGRKRQGGPARKETPAPERPSGPVPPPPETLARDPRVTLPMDMVELPGGSFWMGSRDDDPLADLNEKPRHEVEVGPFVIGRYPVTQAQYAAVMSHNPGEPRGATLPVNHVSWQDAARFCTELSRREGLRPAYAFREGNGGLEVTWDRQAEGYRLPTEAEWEYAARGGTDTAWSFGNDESGIGEHAWYRENSGGQVQPVGQRTPNPKGVHDVHGNVWEWCWDWFGSYVISPNQRVNPVGPPAGNYRVQRGGSWGVVPRRLRSACRNGLRPTDQLTLVGFRCARAVPRQHGR